MEKALARGLDPEEINELCIQATMTKSMVWTTPEDDSERGAFPSRWPC